MQTDTHPIELAAGLHLIPMTCRADGRLSTDRPQDSGDTTINSYLVTEPGAALLLETGMPAHEQDMVDAIAAVLNAETKLSIWPMRYQEFAAVANVRPIVERFDVDAVYGAFEEIAAWTDFRPEHAPYGTPSGAGAAMGRLQSRVVRRDEAIAVGSGGREVLVVDAPLRMLPVNWGYDESTKTLFTADAFSYARRPAAATPVITDEHDPPVREQVWDQMVGSRFWWLPGARTEPIRRGLDELRSRHEIEIIAPAYGCVLHGSTVVDEHLQMMDEILAAAARKEPIGLGTGLWPLKDAREAVA